ncbi:splicing regulator ARVCF-like isoform X8 [Asterias amurensis]|uniref:splicing regulator ARVCF-like isoform X8 n=1 Tax=Asterias amurensis TaxID=7602 RepID=UPI003AB6CACC
MPDRNNGQEQALRSAITKAQEDLIAEPDTPSYILKTVRQQEEKFEKLTRELDQENRNVINQFERSQQESETGTFASISETDDSFSFRRSAVNESVLESESSISSKAYNSSHLIDSALDTLRAHNMDASDTMQYSGYGAVPDRSYHEYGSPAVNGHTDASPGPKQQVKKTTQVTITKHTVQTRIVHSPDGRDSPAVAHSPAPYDNRDYSRPSNYPAHPANNYGNESPYPGDQYDASDPSRQYERTPSVDGSERQGYRGDPVRDPYDRSYNDTPSDMYAPSIEGSERYGTAPRSENPYSSPRPQYGDRYDDRPVEPRDNYNYSDQYDRYPQSGQPKEDWNPPPPANDYNPAFNDSYRPDDITRETANDQMAPIASMDRTGSQDTVEYDKYDKPFDKGSYRYPYRPTQQVHRSHDSIPRKSSMGSSGKGDPQWRTPDLQEIIDYLSHPNPAIVANAAGYLQHLTFEDDPIKNKTRSLNGIPVLVELLGNPTPDVHKCACGALRNISFGKPNEENKIAIKNAGGIPALIRLLRTTRDPVTKELVTGTLWNLSSSEPLKKPIIDDGLSVFVNDVIIPDSGWTPENPDNKLPTDYAWTPLYRNTTGCLRNVSSNGPDARKKMRDCVGLVDALIHVVKSAIDTNNMDNKVVENAMCIIRNLSFKISNEANHPDAVPAAPLRSAPSKYGPASTAQKKPKGPTGCFGADDTSGCFGGNKKKKMEASTTQGRPATSTLPRGATWDPNMAIPDRKCPPKGVELLFAHEMVRPYLTLLSECSNHVTLEATTGTLQNMASGEWVWALYIRAQVRKEKGLPVLVELLRMENDKIVSAVARALRNLSLDSRNKELIGKYAMRDLVFRLPSGSVAADNKQLSTDSLTAVLSALQELINKNAENSKSLRDASGIEKLVSITKSRNKYSQTIVKCAYQVLNTMWGFKDLRALYKQDGWDEQHFNPGIWTTTKSPSKSNTLPPGGRTTSPAPVRSASTPATPGQRIDYQASTLPVKSGPPKDEGAPPGYNSYDRRQNDTLGRSDPYSYRDPAPSERSRDDIPMRELNYASLDHGNANDSAGRRGPPVGGVAVFGRQGSQPQRDNVVYAQVNKDRTKTDSVLLDSGGPAGDSWV